MTLQVHHFGIVVADIEEYLRSSAWHRAGPIVTDPIQRANLCMAAMPDDAQPLIELIQPVDKESPTWNSLERTPGWHHICLSCSSTEEGDALMRESRMVPVTPWQAAKLFDGRLIRFAYTRNRELVEFVADDGRD